MAIVQRKPPKRTFVLSHPVRLHDDELVDWHISDSKYIDESSRENHDALLEVISKGDRGNFLWDICYTDSEAGSACSRASRRWWGTLRIGYIHVYNRNPTDLEHPEAWLLVASRIDI